MQPNAARASGAWPQLRGWARNKGARRGESAAAGHGGAVSPPAAPPDDRGCGSAHGAPRSRPASAVVTARAAGSCNARPFARARRAARLSAVEHGACSIGGDSACRVLADRVGSGGAVAARVNILKATLAPLAADGGAAGGVRRGAAPG
eukprot:4191095-Prymnesium_polylepis.1